MRTPECAHAASVRRPPAKTRRESIPGGLSKTSLFLTVLAGGRRTEAACNSVAVGGEKAPPSVSSSEHATLCRTARLAKPRALRYVDARGRGQRALISRVGRSRGRGRRSHSPSSETVKNRDVF